MAVATTRELDGAMILYRPVGLHELQLIYEAELRAFPPRLPEQPIFYPVLNQEYATQIARDWNTKARSFAGYVTRFEIKDAYVQRFERQVVGGRIHEELWVPAEELSNFNRHIVGTIAVVDAHFGPQFRGYIPPRGSFGLEGRDAIEQFDFLSDALRVNAMDFPRAITANQLAVFLHYPFWLRHDFSGQGLDPERREQVLVAVRESWINAFPLMPLPLAQA
jgi:hypothetical protein